MKIKDSFIDRIAFRCKYEIDQYNLLYPKNPITIEEITEEVKKKQQKQK